MSRMPDRLPRPDPPSISTFRVQFPEFASHNDTRVNEMLRVAYEIHSAKASATLYLAAHLLALEGERTAGMDGGSGEISIETSVGGKAVHYKTMASKSGEDVFFSRTSYGRMFLTLESRTARRGLPIMVL